MKKYKLNPQKTLAILIGASKYADFDAIKPILNNVKTLSELLLDKSVFGLPKDNVKIILEEDSTTTTQKLIHYTKNAKKQGINTLVLYFVGHGYRRADGQYFLATTNTIKNLVNLNGSTALPYNTVKTIIKNARLSQNIIILDACYSGLAVQGDAEFQELEQEGTYTITSSSNREVSYFDNDLKYTLFTGELLNILENGLPVEEEMLSLNHLYLALRKAVKTKNPKMSPQQLISKELIASNYFFFKNKTFDHDAEAVEEIKVDIKKHEKFIFKGHHQKAKRRFKDLLEYVEEEISNDLHKNHLTKTIKNYITFCENFNTFKPIIETIQAQKNATIKESRDLALQKLHTLQKELLTNQNTHQKQIESMNDQLIIHKNDVIEQRLIITKREEEINQLHHTIKLNDNNYNATIKTLKKEHTAQLKQIEKNITPTPRKKLSKTDHPHLMEVNQKSLPRGLLVGNPSDYRCVDLFAIWEKSIVSKIYMRDIFIQRVNNFVFEEQKALTEIHSQRTGEVGGWILGRFHKKTGKKQSYTIVFERFVPIHQSPSPIHQLQFKSNSFNSLNKAIDLYSKENLQLVGWFHTHPGWGVFLSSDDHKVHDTIFKEPYQIAMVLDNVNTSHDIGFFSKYKGINNIELNDKSDHYHRWSDFSDWLKLS